MSGRHPQPDPIAPGEESVWEYPRPPRLESVAERVRVEFGGRVVIDTTRALRMLETSHPPTFYLPFEDADPDAFQPCLGRSFCEWKGVAEYFDVFADGARAPRSAWRYPAPSAEYAALAGHLSLYAGPMDACWVGDHRVTPQPGQFYGGWITPGIRGPFKGEPGTEFW
ncbi:MAG: DUF427 domain-containing protein [Pseudomonadota bacterium]|nr:DUF427 domain-containing protein [Pseudomonadota bacterium]